MQGLTVSPSPRHTVPLSPCPLQLWQCCLTKLLSFEQISTKGIAVFFFGGRRGSAGEIRVNVIDEVLNPEYLTVDGGPHILQIDWWKFTDSIGDRAIQVIAVLDDNATQEEWSGARTLGAARRETFNESSRKVGSGHSPGCRRSGLRCGALSHPNSRFTTIVSPNSSAKFFQRRAERRGTRLCAQPFHSIDQVFALFLQIGDLILKFRQPDLLVGAGGRQCALRSE